ncbi:NAD-dependent malic enzyme [Planotetraspora sp. A-T 1434]|uniref:NAD-dependent malic enzyme n=1 Tax=Planotetraspora sp. A-T 1434 TaxID=2979219 RepID=UPI0021C22C55|nr:NAD-dependent malic enzyme [Planotetraspora sp. A-T 1434]MCT9931824.1 NAD-dependent malic enzyme [Planotetraspora sp. A-T 1434]
MSAVKQGRKFREEPDGSYVTSARGMDVLRDPVLNKGTAFTPEERAELGLDSLLPPVVMGLDEQARLAYGQYRAQPTNLRRNVYLTALHDRNEVLFHRLLGEHLGEMLPIVYDPTEGEAIRQYSREYRRPRGASLSIDHPDSVQRIFENLGLGAGDLDLIVASDAEDILGVGDWGVGGGLDIAVSTIAVYTAAAGIDPARAIPVALDVGTGNQQLLADPFYVGNRHSRVRGRRYDDFIDTFVSAVSRLFPHAVLHLEGFTAENGRRILERHAGRACVFDGGIQATGAITLASALSATHVTGTPLHEQRIVVFGFGTAGVGIADQLRGAMIRDGVDERAATRRIWALDASGLLTDDMPFPIAPDRASYARPAAEVASWRREEDGRIGLAEVVARVRPTMLIGVSGARGAFTEPVVREMAAHVERPVIFPLSHPADRIEATPGDLVRWTGGRALVVTGVPSGPVMHDGVGYAIGHADNALVYPGLGLGAIVSRATRISTGMLSTAAETVAGLVDVHTPGASLLPPVDELRTVSATVAADVADRAAKEGLARAELPDTLQQVRDAMWEPVYRHVKAAGA